MRTRQSGVDLPHPEARLQVHEGALSRFEEESRVAADGFCARQSLPAPQAAGPARGVVSAEAEDGLRRHGTRPQISRVFQDIFRRQPPKKTAPPPAAKNKRLFRASLTEKLRQAPLFGLQRWGKCSIVQTS